LGKTPWKTRIILKFVLIYHLYISIFKISPIYPELFINIIIFSKLKSIKNAIPFTYAFTRIGPFLMFSFFERKIEQTCIKAIFLPFNSLLLAIISSRWKSASTTLWSHQVIWLECYSCWCRLYAEFSWGAEKPKETSSKPVSTWNWFRTRCKLSAIMFARLLDFTWNTRKLHRFVQRCRWLSCTSFERILNQDRMQRTLSSKFDRKNKRLQRIVMSCRRARIGLRKTASKPNRFTPNGNLSPG